MFDSLEKRSHTLLGLELPRKLLANSWKAKTETTHTVLSWQKRDRNYCSSNDAIHSLVICYVTTVQLKTKYINWREACYFPCKPPLLVFSLSTPWPIAPPRVTIALGFVSGSAPRCLGRDGIERESGSPSLKPPRCSASNQVRYSAMPNQRTAKYSEETSVSQVCTGKDRPSAKQIPELVCTTGRVSCVLRVGYHCSAEITSRNNKTYNYAAPHIYLSILS